MSDLVAGGRSVTDDDECVPAFEELVKKKAGQWWVAESSLPCPKETLLAALMAARDAAYPADIARVNDLSAQACSSPSRGWVTVVEAR